MARSLTSLTSLALLVAAALCGAALAAPSPRQRVVLADPDPELRHAMEQALAPYHLEVVIEGSAPADASIAEQRADADTARFVVWRDGDQLVVYDRELGTTERRASQAGVLDPPTAAAAALTIKTMMRLPPPPPPAPPPVQPAPPQPAPEPAPGIELRLQAGIASRIARGDETSTSVRFAGAAAIRPWPSAGWRFGVAADGGTATSVERAGFKGAWSEWSALAIVSWSYARGGWEIEPLVGFGVRRSMLDGLEMMTARSEAATLATARGGVWARWRLARLTVGAGLAADDVFGTPTYTKGTPAVIFQVPGTALELGGVIAVDL
ncbi:MAG TPA: hypothetical protein VK601_07535 [Kofleriaceae bacterium]|nr:hypothetical protein [Kofleriaceae bacterium]